jgi:uncharacterized protein
MSDPPFVLLPPSQGKSHGGRRRYSPRSGTFRSLGPRRVEVIDQLAKMIGTTPGSAATILGAKGDLLDRAVAAVDQLTAGAAPALPARHRYTGVVWDHLDPVSLPDEAMARVLVPSALMGVVAGTDPTPDYRLTFTASLPELGRLDQWWRPTLTRALARRLRGSTVVEMLPAEHQRAIDLDELATHTSLVRVRFVSEDGARAAGHAAKAVKGIAARTVLVEGIDALVDLRWEGWTARPAADDLIEVVAPA